MLITGLHGKEMVRDKEYGNSPVLSSPEVYELQRTLDLGKFELETLFKLH